MRIHRKLMGQLAWCVWRWRRDCASNKVEDSTWGSPSPSDCMLCCRDICHCINVHVHTCMHACSHRHRSEPTHTQVHMNGHTHIHPHRHTGMCTHIHITYTQIIVKFKKIWKLRWYSNFEKQYEVKVVGSIAGTRGNPWVCYCWKLYSLVLDQHMSACHQMRQKPMETASLGKDFRTENTAGNAWPVCSPLSHKINDSFGCLSVILSVMHGADMIIPRNPRFFFLKYLSLKFFGSWYFSGSLSKYEV